MIHSENGKVTIDGTSKELIEDVVFALKSLIKHEIIEPVEIFDFLPLVFEDTNVCMIKGSEEELPEILDAIQDLVDDADESDDTDDSDDLDDGNVDDIFKFLGGGK